MEGIPIAVQKYKSNIIINFYYNIENEIQDKNYDTSFLVIRN
jgi:hypothetical protein